MIDLTAEEQQAIAPLLAAAEAYVTAIADNDAAYGAETKARLELQAALLVARARTDEWGNDRLDDLHRLEARIRTLEAALGGAR